MALRYGKIQRQHIGRVDLHRYFEYFPILIEKLNFRAKTRKFESSDNRSKLSISAQ